MLLPPATHVRIGSTEQKYHQLLHTRLLEIVTVKSKGIPYLAQLSTQSVLEDDAALCTPYVSSCVWVNVIGLRID